MSELNIKMSRLSSRTQLPSDATAHSHQTPFIKTGILLCSSSSNTVTLLSLELAVTGSHVLSLLISDAESDSLIFLCDTTEMMNQLSKYFSLIVWLLFTSSIVRWPQRDNVFMSEARGILIDDSRRLHLYLYSYLYLYLADAFI